MQKFPWDYSLCFHQSNIRFQRNDRGRCGKKGCSSQSMNGMIVTGRYGSELASDDGYCVPLAPRPRWKRFASVRIRRELQLLAVQILHAVGDFCFR